MAEKLSICFTMVEPQDFLWFVSQDFGYRTTVQDIINNYALMYAFNHLIPGFQGKSFVLHGKEALMPKYDEEVMLWIERCRFYFSPHHRLTANIVSLKRNTVDEKTKTTMAGLRSARNIPALVSTAMLMPHSSFVGIAVLPVDSCPTEGLFRLGKKKRQARFHIIPADQVEKVVQKEDMKVPVWHLVNLGDYPELFGKTEELLRIFEGTISYIKPRPVAYGSFRLRRFCRVRVPDQFMTLCKMVDPSFYLEREVNVLLPSSLMEAM